MTPRAKISLSVAVIALFLGSAYTFFNTTERGGSLAMDALRGGNSLPASVLSACSLEVAPRVAAKFSQPLEVDQATKDSLKNLWTKNYQRECLSKKGYNADGSLAPRSVITRKDDLSMYKNTVSGFSFAIARPAEILSDNVLDADFDPNVLSSTIVFDGKNFAINSYAPRTNVNTVNDLAQTYAVNPFSSALIVDTGLTKSNYDVPIMRISEADATSRIIFVTQSRRIISISGKNIPVGIMDGIAQTIKTF